MSTPHLEEMRDTVRRQYPNKTWANKVKHMGRQQIYALYCKIIKDGSLHSKDERIAESLFGPFITGTQIHLF